MPLLTKISVPSLQGLKNTIAQMNYLEQLSFNQTNFVNFVFKNFYSNCKACIPGKIWNYMKQNFRYSSDDPFDELITAPYILLETLKGDCDDFSLFAKTCLDILGGFNTNYILFGKEKNSFSHVACFCYRGTWKNVFIDPVIIDGANEQFNLYPPQYKFFKII